MTTAKTTAVAWHDDENGIPHLIDPRNPDGPGTPIVFTDGESWALAEIDIHGYDDEKQKLFAARPAADRARINEKREVAYHRIVTRAAARMTTATESN